MELIELDVKLEKSELEILEKLNVDFAIHNYSHNTTLFDGVGYLIFKRSGMWYCYFMVSDSMNEPLDRLHENYKDYESYTLEELRSFLENVNQHAYEYTKEIFTHLKKIN